MSGRFVDVRRTEDYVFAACLCGQSSLVPVDHALKNEAISCRCGARINVDEALIEKLTREERIRISAKHMKAVSGKSVKPTSLTL